MISYISRGFFTRIKTDEDLTEPSRTVKDVEYAKWVVVIPPEKIKELGWREGLELELDAKEDKIILKPKK